MKILLRIFDISFCFLLSAYTSCGCNKTTHIYFRNIIISICSSSSRHAFTFSPRHWMIYGGNFAYSRYPSYSHFKSSKPIRRTFSTNSFAICMKTQPHKWGLNLNTLFWRAKCCTSFERLRVSTLPHFLEWRQFKAHIDHKKITFKSVGC